MNEARAVQPGAGPGGAAATRTLPRDISSFTGRAHELDRLAPGAAAAGGVIGIYAIDGRAGIGKTAFAVHAAHQLAGSFPDGQVFLPLHGHTAGQRPVAPAHALASLLLTAGVDARQIPAGLPARAQLWRDRLAGGCCWSWTTPPGTSRSGRCCRAPNHASCWSRAGGG